MILSVKAQKFLVWWSIVFVAGFGYAFSQLLHMCPPPPPMLSPADVAAYYVKFASPMLVGAMLAAWFSGFTLPFVTVLSAQMIRTEGGLSVWSILQFAGGIMMGIFLVLPPIFWGAAAFHPDRIADVTAGINDIGIITMVTTDQYYMFQSVAVIVVCLTSRAAADNPFPRWLGYVWIVCGLIFEVGPLPFLFKSGMLAWNGIIPFWFPLIFFGVQLVATFVALLMALGKQTDSRVVLA